MESLTERLKSLDGVTNVKKQGTTRHSIQIEAPEAKVSFA